MYWVSFVSLGSSREENCVSCVFRVTAPGLAYLYSFGGLHSLTSHWNNPDTWICRCMRAWAAHRTDTTSIPWLARSDLVSSYLGKDFCVFPVLELNSDRDWVNAVASRVDDKAGALTPSQSLDKWVLCWDDQRHLRHCTHCEGSFVRPLWGLTHGPYPGKHVWSKIMYSQRNILSSHLTNNQEVSSFPHLVNCYTLHPRERIKMILRHARNLSGSSNATLQSPFMEHLEKCLLRAAFCLSC